MLWVTEFQSYAFACDVLDKESRLPECHQLLVLSTVNDVPET